MCLVTIITLEESVPIESNFSIFHNHLHILLAYLYQFYYFERFMKLFIDCGKNILLSFFSVIYFFGNKINESLSLRVLLIDIQDTCIRYVS